MSIKAVGEEGCCDVRGWVDQYTSFEKLIAVGYYGGATDGAARCGCGRAFRFEMLDEWVRAENDRLRIFALSPLPPFVFESLSEYCRRAGPPSWPEWVPAWAFESDTQHESADRALEVILKQAGPISALVAANSLLNARVIKACVLTQPLDRSRPRDAWRVLGLDNLRSAPIYVR